MLLADVSRVMLLVLYGCEQATTIPGPDLTIWHVTRILKEEPDAYQNCRAPIRYTYGIRVPDPVIPHTIESPVQKNDHIASTTMYV